MTMGELIQLSTFRLPAVHFLDLPRWRGLRRGIVRGATRESVRRLDRGGCFDVPKRVVRASVASERFPVTIWERPVVRQGEPRLYHAFDLMTLQVALWLRREGLRSGQIIALLRGPNAVRYSLLARDAYEPDAQLMYVPHLWTLTTERQFAETVALLRTETWTPEPDMVLPLSWLGIFNGGLERLRQLRAHSGGIVSHRRTVPVGALLARQKRRPASIGIVSSADGGTDLIG